MLPNENWAGHNAECSWVICHAARIINDQNLIQKTEEVAVLMMNEVVRLARDKTNGGYANLISENGVQEEDKSWWPQAEVVLGLLNVYKITGEENYQTGQEHGYCIGHYNGVQNNNTYKVVHATDTFTTLGSTAQPKGHDGISSASCASASAYILGGD